MKTSSMVLGVLLFAVATAIIYAWGMYRQMHKSQDLMNLLFSSGEARVHKFLRKNGRIRVSEAQKLVEGMTVHFPFSSDKATVTDTKDFVDKLMQYMVKTGQVRYENGYYIKEKQ